MFVLHRILNGQEKLVLVCFTHKVLIEKCLILGHGSLDTNYSISLIIIIIIIEGIRNCVSLILGWWRNQGQPSTSMRGITTFVAI